MWSLSGRVTDLLHPCTSNLTRDPCVSHVYCSDPDVQSVEVTSISACCTMASMQLLSLLITSLQQSLMLLFRCRLLLQQRKVDPEVLSGMPQLFLNYTSKHIGVRAVAIVGGGGGGHQICYNSSVLLSSPM